jgi:hypothetical protein
MIRLSSRDNSFSYSRTGSRLVPEFQKTRGMGARLTEAMYQKRYKSKRYGFLISDDDLPYPFNISRNFSNAVSLRRDIGCRLRNRLKATLRGGVIDGAFRMRSARSTCGRFR